MKLIEIIIIEKEKDEIIDFVEKIFNYNNDIINFNFSILFLDGSVNNKWKGSFLEFIDEIQKSENGISFDFHKLKDVFIDFNQIFDLLLVIYHNSSIIKKYSFDEEKTMYENCYLTIAYFDGGFWEISSQNNSLIDYLKGIYPNSKYV